MIKWIGLVLPPFPFCCLSSDRGTILFHWPKHGFIWKTRSQCSAEKGDKPVNILGLIQVPGLHPANGLITVMTLKITELKY